MSHVDQFITERRYLKNVSPKTIIWYEHSFKAFKDALDSRASLVSRVTELRQRGVSATSVNTYLRCINAYLRWLHLEHKHELLKIPRLKEEVRVLATLSPDQVQRIIRFKAIGANLSRAHTFCLLVLDTGLRSAEALSLRWEKVDLENLVLTVLGKGGRHRVIPISFECRKVLFRWKQHKCFELVFSTRNGTSPTQRNLQRDIKALAQKAGIKGVRASPHTLPL